MASCIYLADLFGNQKKANEFVYKYPVFNHEVHRAIIAKGNIIEGIKAEV